MSKKAKTLITVDTEKLRKQKSGKIEDRSIIVMKDDSGDNDFSYKNPTKTGFKDNLIQKIDQGADREWTIKALNKKDKVSFVDFEGSDALNLYQKKPIKEGKTKMKTKVRSDLKEYTKISYTFKIEFEGNQYFWDPDDETRYPPS